MRRLSFVSAALVFALYGGLLAQQQQPPAKKRAPRLTTEDIVAEKSAQKTVEVSAEEAAAATAADETAPKTEAADEKVTPEEAAWRENIRQAREAAKQAQRAAEEGELRVTDIRNQLGATNQTTRERNESAGELEAAGGQLAELRREALKAKQDLEKLVEYGRDKHFSEPAEKKPAQGDEKGNEEHFRKRFVELNEKLDTASRQIQLYENRIREINQRMQNNSGSGDNFFLSQLQQEKDDAQVKMEEARETQSKLHDDIDALKREAANAGVAPGVFR